MVLWMQDPSFRRLVGWKDESWDAPEFKVVNIMEDYFESVKMKVSSSF